MGFSGRSMNLESWLPWFCQLPNFDLMWVIFLLKGGMTKISSRVLLGSDFL